MNPTDLGKYIDKAIELIGEEYGKASDDLIFNVATMLASEDQRGYKHAKVGLKDLEKTATKWSGLFIGAFFLFGMSSVLTALREVGIKDNRNTLSKLEIDQIKTLSNESNSYLKKVSNQWDGKLNSLNRRVKIQGQMPVQSPASSVFGVTKKWDLESTIKDNMSADFKRGLVEVVDRNGVHRKFKSQNYAKMVGHQTIMNSFNAGVKTRCYENSIDLVQVSPNASLVNDFCNLYAGKVFSLSGTDPQFPPIQLLPQGGPPFHMWCRHYFIPYIPAYHSEKENINASSVEEWALIGKNNSEQDIIKRYAQTFGKVARKEPSPKVTFSPDKLLNVNETWNKAVKSFTTKNS